MLAERSIQKEKKRRNVSSIETAQAKGHLVLEERILYSRRFDLREQHENVF